MSSWERLAQPDQFAILRVPKQKRLIQSRPGCHWLTWSSRMAYGVEMVESDALEIAGLPVDAAMDLLSVRQISDRADWGRMPKSE